MLVLLFFVPRLVGEIIRRGHTCLTGRQAWSLDEPYRHVGLFFGRDSFGNDEDYCAEDHNNEVSEQCVIRDPVNFSEDLTVEEVQRPSHDGLTPEVIDCPADAHEDDNKTDCSECFFHGFRL